MDRYWLLTWTTYGTWLPGDRRGFVSPVDDATTGQAVLHNTPGTPYDADLPDLERHARAALSEEAVWLTAVQADAVAVQLRETAAYRGWKVLALAVMANHVHVVVGVPGDPDPEKLLGDFKAWATRKLKALWPGRDRWWTQSGSRRILRTADAVQRASEYVRDQSRPLAVWIDPIVGPGERRGVSPPVLRSEPAG